MTIEVKTFDELTKIELYEILRLRSEVFVLEQNCVYQDIDQKDLQALHIIGTKDSQIVAYARAMDSGIYFSEAAFGRVLVRENYRKMGYGHKITSASIAAIKEHFDADEIRISAQVYLITFYQSHGFQTIGNRYMEEGIPHISMLLSLKSG